MFNGQGSGIIHKPFMNDYRLAWKAQNHYWDENGPYSDELCDQFEGWKAQWLQTLHVLPTSDFGWRMAFGLIEATKGPKIANKDEIRERVDLKDLIMQYTTLRQLGGDRLQGKCPFHQDDKPSMSIDRKRGLWYCFAEGIGGDCFSFLMKAHDLSFKEALELLNKII